MVWSREEAADTGNNKQDGTDHPVPDGEHAPYDSGEAAHEDDKGGAGQPCLPLYRQKGDSENRAQGAADNTKQARCPTHVAFSPEPIALAQVYAPTSCMYTS